MTRVSAPSRVHFGLFHVPAEGFTHWPAIDSGPGLPVRAFGGAGLVVDSPGVVVTVRPSDSWQVEGSHASRAQAFALRFTTSLPEPDRLPFQVLVERCPAGAGIAIEDAVVLAELLATEASIPALLDRFMARRFERCRLVVETAVRLGGMEKDPTIPIQAHLDLMTATFRELAQPI